MGKTSYKNTEKLIKEISGKIDQLNSGKLNLEELDELVNSGKDLYEQLVILRYKAYDAFGEPAVKAEEILPDPKPVENTAPEKEEETETAFDFTSFGSTENTTDQPVFDFTGGSDETPEIEEKETEKPAVNVPLTSTQPEKKTEESLSNSLNETLKKEEEPSLRKKLQNSPVSDIKTHISIAKKFEYISTMFDGDSDAYDEAIDFLNTCATGKDAQLKLNEYTNQYNWDPEDKSIIKFIELVERRYL